MNTAEKHLDKVNYVRAQPTGSGPLTAPRDQLRIMLDANCAGHPGTLRRRHAEPAVAAANVD